MSDFQAPSSGIVGASSSAGVLRRARVGLVYLLKATFSQDMAAPLPASLPIDTGGPLTVVQVDGQLSQSGGKLVFPAQTTPAWGDLYLVEATGRSRIAGRALLATINLSAAAYHWFGFNDDATPADAVSGGEAFRIQPAGQPWVKGSSGLTDTGITLITATDYQYAIVLRATGAWFFLRGEVLVNWTLVWVTNTNTTATLYPAFSVYNASGTLDNFRVLDLGTYDSRFATDEGLATARIASNSAGDTIAHPADAWIEQTLTAATGVDKDLYVRWTDDANCWIVRQNQAGATVKLIEKVAGVETARGSVATTYTNATAYRQIAICEGSVIKVYVDTTLKITYSSASFQATATTAKAQSAGAEFKSYPRTVDLPGGV